MNAKKVLILIAGFVSLLATCLLLTDNDLNMNAQKASEREGTTTSFPLPAEAATTAPPQAERIADVAAMSQGDVATLPPVIDCFWLYINTVRNVPAGHGRSEKIREPASKLMEMSDEQLRALGVVAPTNDGATTRFSRKLCHALMRQWHARAQETGEDLREEVLSFFVQSMTCPQETSPPA
jgi:hypothetical protein